MGGARHGQVNLARRPFVNRRPILRLAVLLWLLGIGLLIVNVRLYAGHWRGKAMNSQRLAEVALELQRERQELSALDRELGRVNLAREDRQAAFLNSLITYRTFPWSSLFDDLEEVLPRQVRLLSVKPSVKLATGTEERRGRRRGRSRTPAETAGGGAAQAPLKRNEVSLSLSAVAEDEDALYELIDRLYASPSFRDPFLPGETRNLEDGSTSFSVSVVYLTRPELPEEVAPALAEDASSAAAGPDDVVVVSPEEGTALPRDEEDEAEAEEPEEPEVAAEASPAPAEREVVTADRDRPAGADRPVAAPAAEVDEPAPPATRRRTAPRRSAAPPPPVTAPPRAVAPSAVRPAVPPAASRPAAGSSAARRSGTPPPPRPQTGRPPAGRPSPAERPSPGRPEPEQPPAEEKPPFVEPAASATPRVQSGSLLAIPGHPLWPRSPDPEAVT